MSNENEHLSCEETNMCESCKTRNDIVNFYANAMLNNDITMRQAFEEVYFAGYNEGYDGALVDDLETKEMLLAARNGLLSEEELEELQDMDE